MKPYSSKPLYVCCHPNGATHRSATSGGGSLQNSTAKTHFTRSHVRPKWRCMKPTRSRLWGRVQRWFNLKFFRQRCLFLALLTAVAVCHLYVSGLRSNANSLACIVFSAGSSSSSLMFFICLQNFTKIILYPNKMLYKNSR